MKPGLSIKLVEIYFSACTSPHRLGKDFQSRDATPELAVSLATQDETHRTHFQPMAKGPDVVKHAWDEVALLFT